MSYTFDICVKIFVLFVSYLLLENNYGIPVIYHDSLIEHLLKPGHKIHKFHNFFITPIFIWYRVSKEKDIPSYIL